MDVIDFLKDLVNIPSPSGKEKEIAGRIKQEFKKLNYDEIIQIKNNICGRIGSGDIVILYDAHMDVVEPGQGWKADPYKVRTDNGYLIGRGACDDKGSLAAMVYGGSRAKTENVALYVLGSVKEEVAEGNGLRDFFGNTGIKPDFVIIGEPSELKIARGNRGRLGVRIDIKGEAGHASNPDKGVNAIYKATQIVEQIKLLNSRLDVDSVAVTKIETTNSNINIIPEECRIYCDYRSGVGRKKQDIIDMLKSYISDEDKITAITPYYQPWLMESDHPLIKAAGRCGEEVLEKKEIINWEFCTNGSYTAGELGIPTVGFGPGTGEKAHSAEENIKISSVITAVRFFEALPKFISETVGVIK